LRETKLNSKERLHRSSILSEADPVLLLPVIIKDIKEAKKSFITMCRLLRVKCPHLSKKLQMKCILFKTSQTETASLATMTGPNQAIKERN